MVEIDRLVYLRVNYYIDIFAITVFALNFALLALQTKPKMIYTRWMGNARQGLMFYKQNACCAYFGDQ